MDNPEDGEYNWKGWSIEPGQKLKSKKKKSRRCCDRTRINAQCSYS